MMPNDVRLADKQPQAKTRVLNPIVNHPAAQAIFVFSRSWTRAVTPRNPKPTSARSLGRS